MRLRPQIDRVADDGRRRHAAGVEFVDCFRLELFAGGHDIDLAVLIAKIDMAFGQDWRCRELRRSRVPANVVCRSRRRRTRRKPLSLTINRLSPSSSNEGRDGTALIVFQTMSSCGNMPWPPCLTASKPFGWPLVKKIKLWPKTGLQASFMPPVWMRQSSSPDLGSYAIVASAAGEISCRLPFNSRIDGVEYAL